MSPKKNRDTKLISTSRPPRSCVYSHHAMFVGNSVGTNALKLYSFLLCHDPQSVNCDNLPSRTPIEHVKMKSAPNFKKKTKDEECEVTQCHAEKITKICGLNFHYTCINMYVNYTWRKHKLLSRATKTRL